MGDETECLGSEAGRAIERGGRYTHADHGRIECRGIWRGTQWVDEVDEFDEEETIIVRFSPDGGDWSDELTESLETFLAATE